MSDKKQHFGNLLKGVGFGVVNLFVALAIGFFLAPYIRNTLGDRLNGIWILAGTFAGTFALIDMGIDGAVARYFTFHFAKGDKEECMRLSNTAFFLYLALGFIGFEYITLLGWGAYVLNPNMQDRDLLLIVVFINAVIFGISFPLKALTGIVNGTLRQELTGSRDLFFRVLTAFVTFGVLYYGGRLISMSLVGLVFTLINMVILYRLVFVVFPEFRFRPTFFRRELLGKLFSYGFSTFLAFLGGMMRNNGNLFFLAAMVSIDSISLYSIISLSLTSHFFNLTEMICGNWLIYWVTFLVADEDDSLLKQTLNLAYKFSTYISTFIAFGLIFWGYDFIWRWIGEDAVIAYPSLVLLTLGVWVSQCQVPNSKYLFGIAKHRLVGYISLFSAVEGILLTFIFLKLGWGINGAALSTLIVVLIERGIVIPWYTCRVRGISCAAYHFRIFTYMSKALAACVVPLIISWFLLGPSYPRLFLVGGLSVLTYFPVIYWIGFNKSEKEQLSGMVLKKLFHGKFVPKTS